ncbi:DUF305 domain-containing protein [Georgenia faecalis]|uniref:DUF305 domain-containing protein n=1 Tax=Georgenia faecalis TaxID=2483799 RepID=UPI000FD933EF|nr:DUF305 domain-containing protein [Georgenia faecalis]
MRAALARRALVAVMCGVLAAGCTQARAREDAAATVQARPLEADVCFVEMMVPHHQQAVEMSEILLDKDGVWERGQRFARYVAATQGQEILAMREWLAAWDGALTDAAEQLNAGGSGPRGVPGAGDAPAGGGGHAGHGAPAVGDEVVLPSCSHAHGVSMDGMLTAEQMDALRGAGATHAQRLYLELMIPHHEGALTMAEEALAEAENAFVRSSARHVVQEQVSELEQLRAMIAALDTGDLGLPDDYVEGEYLTYGADLDPFSGAGPSSEAQDGPP